ncbi:hypothetical protein [Phytoactinopolyspora endophytica]|nr:hypothetical protein [Phytoactinopolyspora endophytica]
MNNFQAVADRVEIEALRGEFGPRARMGHRSALETPMIIED